MLLFATVVVVYIVRHTYADSLFHIANDNSQLVAEGLRDSLKQPALNLLANSKQQSLTHKDITTLPIWQKIAPFMHQEALYLHTISVLDKNQVAIYSSSAYMLNEHYKEPQLANLLSGKVEQISFNRLAAATSSFKLLASPINQFVNCFRIKDSQVSGAICVHSDYQKLFKTMQVQTRSAIYKLLAILVLIYALTLLSLFWLFKRAKDAKSNYLSIKKQLNHHTKHDDLTGLPNRLRFVERVEQLTLQCAENEHANLVILMMDLDSFRNINESMGHLAGNSILKQTAQRLKLVNRSEDLLSRLSNDEFAIVMHNVRDIEQVISQTKLIHREFQAPFKVNSRYVFDTISIGINIVQGKNLHADSIIRDANIALSQAKLAGRGQTEIFNQNMHLRALERVELEANLRRGIKANEFVNHYQPIVDLNNMVTHSLEALIRWQPEGHKQIMPGTFINICEEIGIIPEIDSKVLQQALQDLAKWRALLPTLDNLSVNVNHSAKNFKRRPILDNIINGLSKHNIDGKYLAIELTESVIFEHERTATVILQELRNNQVKLCMDDFGTGFSSLSYLHHLKFDMLKIDKSFVDDMQHNREAFDIVHTIINMGESLGIKVTAEGVENEQQLNALKAMGCHYAQGYYFSKPLVADEVVDFIQQQLENSILAKTLQ